MTVILKTLTWRIIGSSSTFLISYLITGQAFIATSIAVIQMVVNTVLYYIHELVWNKVKKAHEALFVDYLK
jgi:uncharacterized membrane protein